MAINSRWSAKQVFACRASGKIGTEEPMAASSSVCATSKAAQNNDG